MSSCPFIIIYNLEVKSLQLIFEERAPVDEIYGCLSFKRVAETYMIRVPGYLSQQWIMLH